MGCKRSSSWKFSISSAIANTKRIEFRRLDRLTENMWQTETGLLHTMVMTIINCNPAIGTDSR